MANIMFSPKFHVDDSTGAPLASGKVYFYEAGTSTPKDTYNAASAAPGTENANPLTLDSRGEATVYGVGSYKVVVKDSLDNTIYTVDNYSISGTVDTADIANGAVTTAKLATNALSADATGRAKMQDGFVTSAKLDTGGVALPSGSTATTQTTGDNTTKVATTAFVAGEFTDKKASDAQALAGTDNTKYITPSLIKRYKGAAKAVFSTSNTAIVNDMVGNATWVSLTQDIGANTITVRFDLSSVPSLSGTNTVVVASAVRSSQESFTVVDSNTIDVVFMYWDNGLDAGLSGWRSYISVYVND